MLCTMCTKKRPKGDVQRSERSSDTHLMASLGSKKQAVESGKDQPMEGALKGDVSGGHAAS